MSTEEKDNGRRSFLIGATATLCTLGVAGLATPFIRAWNPSTRAKAAGAPISVDLSTIPEGSMMVAEWRSKPIYIIKRTQAMLNSLDKLVDQLRDPTSESDQQPDYAKNSNRSIRPDVLVVEGVCTHLGCAPKFRPQETDSDFSGLFCTCHGSKFDFSGRVYKDVPAPTNLQVPPHHYVDNNTLIIGTDQEETV